MRRRRLRHRAGRRHAGGGWTGCVCAGAAVARRLEQDRPRPRPGVARLGVARLGPRLGRCREPFPAAGGAGAAARCLGRAPAPNGARCRGRHRHQPLRPRHRRAGCRRRPRLPASRPDGAAAAAGGAGAIAGSRAAACLRLVLPPRHQPRRARRRRFCPPDRRQPERCRRAAAACAVADGGDAVAAKRRRPPASSIRPGPSRRYSARARSPGRSRPLAADRSGRCCRVGCWRGAASSGPVFLSVVRVSLDYVPVDSTVRQKSREARAHSSGRIRLTPWPYP